MLTSTIIGRLCPEHQQECLGVISLTMLGVGYTTECRDVARATLHPTYPDAKRTYMQAVRDALAEGWRVIYTGAVLGENGDVRY